MIHKIFNKDGFNWWIGVVEDRMDPEKLGRIRVRIFGYHTDDKASLPTKDLPWALPIQPITSAAISGIGSSPLGPVEGTWVIGFFLDGEDCQQPAVFGTIATKAAKLSFTQTEEKPLVENPNTGQVVSSDGKPVVDSQGVPLRQGIPSIPGWELGQTSEKYESGGKGPGVINDYNGSAAGDYGGASYGTYQFASFLPEKMKNGTPRPSAKNSPVLQYIKNSKFRDKFDGLIPATPEFDAKWKEIAAQNPKEFKQDQHDYIQAKYYDVAVSNLKRAGLDLSTYGPAVQDLIWSGAVQLGPANIKPFTQTISGKSSLTETDIVTIVSEWKIKNVGVLFSKSSTNVQNGVKARYEAEKTSLLKLIV